MIAGILIASTAVAAVLLFICARSNMRGIPPIK